MGNRLTYKRLGDYIREVDVRNKDLKVTNLIGLTINKSFITSVANVIGTDLSNYKVIHKEQFACSLMQVSRDAKMPIAMFDEDKAIMSPAYPMFEIINKNKLIPQYLMMWFMRNEFDRETSFYAVGGVRGSLTWEDFCDLRLPIPSIEKQRKIVSDYETLTKRIQHNENMIHKLEETGLAIYRNMFIDELGTKNLPKGWKLGTINDFCKEIKSGGTPKRNNKEFWDSKDFPWLKTGEINNNIITGTEEFISKEGLNHSSAKLIEKGSIIMAMYGATASQIGYLDIESTTNQACCNMTCKSLDDAAFLYFHLLYWQEDIKRLANGGAQENLSQEIIAQQPILIIEDIQCKKPFNFILKNIITKTKENKILTNLQSMLISKI